MARLITTLGPKDAAQLGMILPHEHIFVDLRTPDQSMAMRVQYSSLRG